MAAITALFFTTNWLHDFWYDNGFIESDRQRADRQLRPRRRRRRSAARRSRGQCARRPAQQREHVDARRRHVAALASLLWTGDARPARSATAGDTPADRHRRVRPERTSRDRHARARERPTNGCDRRCTAIDAVHRPDRRSIDRGTCTLQDQGAERAERRRDRHDPRRTTARALRSARARRRRHDHHGDHDRDAVDDAGRRRDAQDRDRSRPTTVDAAPRVGVEHDGDLDTSVIAHEYGHYLHHRLSDCGAQLCSGDERRLGRLRRADVRCCARATTSTARTRSAIYSTVSLDANCGVLRHPPRAVQRRLRRSTRCRSATWRPAPRCRPASRSSCSAPTPRSTTPARSGPRRCGKRTSRCRRPAPRTPTTRATMAQYVVGGLLMTPTDTTPTETRDAILLAARAASSADLTTIAQRSRDAAWAACAISPDRNSTTFTGIVESTDVKGRMFAAPATLQRFDRHVRQRRHPRRDRDRRIYIPVSNSGQAAMTNLSLTVTTTTPGVTITSAPLTVATLDIDETIFATADVAVDDSLVDRDRGRLHRHHQRGQRVRNDHAADRHPAQRRRRRLRHPRPTRSTRRSRCGRRRRETGSTTARPPSMACGTATTKARPPTCG